jgi:hypothetical protein
MVTGMHTPRIDQGVWPPELIGELATATAIDVMAHWYEGHDRFQPSVRHVDRPSPALLRLWDHQAPDVALFVYVPAERDAARAVGAMTQAQRPAPGHMGIWATRFFNHNWRWMLPRAIG